MLHDTGVAGVLVPYSRPVQQFTVRAATTRDVIAIEDLIKPYVLDGRVLGKERVWLYESIQEFVVAERSDGKAIGCGALDVLWRDLGEIRTIAIHPDAGGLGLGSRILSELVERAYALGLDRLFCLTFETRFFAKHGFREVEERIIDDATFHEILRSPDMGVHEFLELPYLKPNTLGNTRMIRELHEAA